MRTIMHMVRCFSDENGKKSAKGYCKETDTGAGYVVL